MDIYRVIECPNCGESLIDGSCIINPEVRELSDAKKACCIGGGPMSKEYKKKCPACKKGL